mmetsp:Transcript_1967/g.4970  ORF Transcript_1967/g.4970 Transcript_1967/m.4970 type:complete len:143 (-) Transcript_1967:420-848(-)
MCEGDRWIAWHCLSSRTGMRAEQIWRELSRSVSTERAARYGSARQKYHQWIPREEVLRDRTITSGRPQEEVLQRGAHRCLLQEDSACESSWSVTTKFANDGERINIERLRESATNRPKRSRPAESDLRALGQSIYPAEEEST